MVSISVVVAMYNARSWLPRFVDSLQHQSFSNFEVLMVDDASTDGSADLVERAAMEDRRLRLIRLETNSGAAAARNRGISEAKGETICFADPDDFLPENSLETRYRAYKKHNAIIRGCHVEIGGDGAIRNYETPPGRLTVVFSPLDEYPRTGIAPFLCAHWTWLFPTKLLRRYNIRNGEGMCNAQDIALLNRAFFHVERMVWIPDIVYCWLKRESSLSNRSYKAEHYINYFRCCEIFYEEAKKRKRLDAADAFFDNYLAFYLSHLLLQQSNGMSDNEAGRIVRFAMGVAERFEVFQRCLPCTQAKPDYCSGIQLLWRTVKNKSPLVFVKILESQREILELSAK